MKRCPQCSKEKEVAEFIRNGGERRWCNSCAQIYKNGRGHRPTRREKLDASSELKVLFKEKSGNRKIGDIPMSISSAVTCPDSCSFKDAGCYAEFWPLRYHWENVVEDGCTWSEFCARVSELPEGQLWRHNVAGDLPGSGDALDVAKLHQLVAANLMSGARGFTFTHRLLHNERERTAVRQANRSGFTINLSADSLEDADTKIGLNCGPVAVVLPSGSERGLRTPAGHHVVICPAQTHEITCEQCQLCANAERKSVVGFLAHGQWYRRVDQIVQLRRSA